MSAVPVESEYFFPERLIDADSYTAKYYHELLRGLTHKLNNLLAVIQGFSSLILLQEGLDELSKENLRHVKEASTSASTLSERVLPAGGCSRVEAMRMSLGEAVPMLIGRIQKAVEERHLPFEARIAPDLPPVTADPGKFRDVMDCLIQNAIEAAEPEGRIMVDILPTGQSPSGGGSHVGVFVRNTGPEIPADKVREIFKPFYTTKDSSHSGIGLSTAYVLAGQMGVDLGVKSAANTTSFWLKVPVAAA